MVQPLCKAVWRFLRKLGMDPPFDPAILLLVFYPKDSNTATSMLTVVQFTIARWWNQPRCPSTDEWTKKHVLYIHNGILLSHKEE